MKSYKFKKDEVFVIAEIGNNHEGSFEVAKEMIHAAANANVNAVKFQTMNPKLFISSNDQKRINQLMKFRLENEEILKLASEAKRLGLIFFSTPFDLESAKFLNNIQPIFKISSGDNNFIQLINTVFEFKKNTIISTGLANESEIDTIYRNWLDRDPEFELALLHCVSSYPVPSKEANLGTINWLKNKYPRAVIGYSDHTIGNEACCLAVSAGAMIIEKHFTIDKNFSDFRDHKLSADLNEMKELVNKIKLIKEMLGTEDKLLQFCEKDMKLAMRRSIAAARDISAETILKESDFLWVRPGDGHPPGEENLFLGKKLKKDVIQGEILSTDIIK